MIDYQKIADSINHYESKGYKRIESPWAVSRAVANITLPEDKQPSDDYVLKHNDKALVASGEQSFLYLNLKNFLPPGMYQTVTPCFRNESFDLTHSKYFMKNELIITDGLFTRDRILNIAESAKEFFEKYFPSEILTIDKVDDTSYDINCNLMYKGEKRIIELGSYGIRSCEFLTWIYGTGIAEPRLSRTQKLYLNGLS
jgi:hypothetical protein